MKSDEMTGGWDRVVGGVIELAPRALLGLVVLVLGLVAAVLAGRAARWLVEKTGLEGLAERMGVAKILYSVGIRFGLAELAGRVAKWATVLATFGVLAEVLGLPGVAEAAAVLLEFLPRFVTAGLVFLAGMVGADICARLVTGLGQRRDDVEHPEFVSKLVYYAILAVSVAMAAEQLGLQVSLISTLIEIVAAAAAFGLALALALSSKGVFSNLLAKHYAQRMFRPGDLLQVGEIRGKVLRYGPLIVWLDCEGGTVSVPCQALLDQAVVLAAQESSEKEDKDVTPEG